VHLLVVKLTGGQPLLYRHAHDVPDAGYRTGKLAVSAALAYNPDALCRLCAGVVGYTQHCFLLYHLLVSSCYLRLFLCRFC
jgi:hypothetical protein